MVRQGLLIMRGSRARSDPPGPAMPSSPAGSQSTAQTTLTLNKHRRVRKRRLFGQCRVMGKRLAKDGRSLPLAAALLASFYAGPVGADLSTAVRQSTNTVSGLHGPAEIIIDHWGIPHIYAGTTRDAIFLQGYNAARDRLWQIDLWRKRGLGLLAKDFGPSYAAQDRAARMFVYRGDMDQEWAAYGPNAKRYADAFVKGLNAFVQEIRDGTRPLPQEFKIAGNQPDLWAAEDVVRVRSHGLTRNVASEVRRAQVACAAGLEPDRLRVKLEPAWTPSVPAGLDPCSVPKDVLAEYDLATREASFSPATKRAEAHDP